MFFFLLFNVIVCLGYLLLIFWLIAQWNKRLEIVSTKEHQPTNQFSIIVPFRNEILNLEKCIKSLKLLNYETNKFEIIAINDHSSDGSEVLINDSNIPLVNAVNTGKKNAISEGISKAKFPFIITVDADCVFHRDWLLTIDSAIRSENCDVLVGAVKIDAQRGFLSSFQFIDFASTMGITSAGINSKRFYLCNGANFIYKRDLFYKVNGFEGNKTIASGDDVFLINKFAEIQNIKISFLKSDFGTVITKPEASINDLYIQRKRWATKTGSYAKPTILMLQGFVFLFSLLIFLDIFLFPFIFGLASFIIGTLVLSAKLIIDFCYLNKMVKFYKGVNIMRCYILASVFYLFYIVFMGFTAMIPTSVEWKSRKI